MCTTVCWTISALMILNILRYYNVKKIKFVMIPLILRFKSKKVLAETLIPPEEEDVQTEIHFVL